METKAPFNLSAAIQCWRENLAQSPAFQAENLAELESHLRDSIVRLETTGLSTEEAFTVADIRIGRDGVLESEFQKINRQSVWLDRFFWMLVGIQLMSHVVNSICAVGRDSLLIGLSRTNVTFGGVSLIPPLAVCVAGNLAYLGGAVAVCWWLLRRKGEVLRRWMEKLLSRPALAAVTFCALLLLSNSVRIVGPFMLKFVTPARFNEMMTILLTSSQISGVIQTAALLGLTLYMAGKRFRTVNA